MLKKSMQFCFAFALVLSSAGEIAQIGQFSNHSLIESDSKPASGSVSYLFPEQITAPAGKALIVPLHFRVVDGMHINSHTPRAEYLIPTVFSFPEGTEARLLNVEYPGGAMISLPMEPKEKFNVYTGEFTLLAKIIAQPGDHLVKAQLRYQACDNNACMPPRTLVVALDIRGN